jgi:hypothetical protein
VRTATTCQLEVTAVMKRLMLEECEAQKCSLSAWIRHAFLSCPQKLPSPPKQSEYPCKIAYCLKPGVLGQLNMLWVVRGYSTRSAFLRAAITWALFHDARRYVDTTTCWVEEEDISRGLQLRMGWYPVLRALRTSYLGIITLGNGYFVHQGKMHTLPRIVVRAIQMIDSGRPCAPFTFRVKTCVTLSTGSAYQRST